MELFSQTGTVSVSGIGKTIMQGCRNDYHRCSEWESGRNFYFATKSKSLNAGLEQQLVQFVTDHKGRKAHYY